MTAIDFLELLNQGVEDWNRWRLENPEQCPALESAYLYEASLSGVNFRNANLSGACLIGADLSGADLAGARLCNVYANTTNFQGASLRAADLSNGNFIEANFRQADLSDAVVETANFTHACLMATCLEGWATERSPVDNSQGHPKVRAQVHAQSMADGVRVKSWQRWAGALGLVAIATTLTWQFSLTTILSSLSLISRPGAANSAKTLTASQIKLVCNESQTDSLTESQPTHVYQDGTQYYGKFVTGHPADGHGRMLYANGNRYDGEYRHGRRNGCGTFTFKNGRRYVGEFKDDLFSGRGVWQLENGDRYLGDFEYNKCNGEGVFLFKDDTARSGVWQQGRLVGEDLTCDRVSADESVRMSADESDPGSVDE